MITNLLRPDHDAEATKPFVFLDLLEGPAPEDFGFPYHPHSGIATLTYAVKMTVSYIDTDRLEGVLPTGGLEWMSAGGGAWHRATIKGGAGDVCGLQLWIALTPKEEEGPSFSKYIPPEQIPRVENVKILLGKYKGVTSELKTSHDVNYFDLSLKTGERFTYTVPPGHSSSFVLVYQGIVKVQDSEAQRELVVFKAEGELIILEAKTDARVIIASAEPHPYALIAKKGSVHTSLDALRKGEVKIAQIREELEIAGKV